MSIENADARCSIHIPLGAGGPLLEATFLSRPNRFLVHAELNGTVVQAHLADRGRLKETLLPGVRLLLACHAGAHRKTAFQAVAAIRAASDLRVGDCARSEDARSDSHAATLISLDTHLPNRLIEAALRAEALLPFRGYTALRREVTVGGSRFDFQLSDAIKHCTVEVKSAGLVRDGIGLFPDAPTERGRRHVAELAGLARAGERASVVFVAQGGDARAVKVDTQIDQAFATELRAAAAAGVEVYAYACPLTPAGIWLGQLIPVLDLD
ncbi:MAG: DNA/RNA nuclease SfsA [Roseiflexaceae bacterium]